MRKVKAEVLDYLDFLYNNHIDDLAEENYKYLIKYEDILIQLYKTDNKEQVLELIKKDLKKSIGSVLENKCFAEFEDIVVNRNINEESLLTYFNIRKRAIFNLIKKYTNDIEITLIIINDFEENQQYFYGRVIDSIIRIKNELKEKERHLSMIFNSTSELMLLVKVETDNSFTPVSLNNAYLNALKFYGINIDKDEFLKLPIEKSLKKFFGSDEQAIKEKIDNYTKAMSNSFVYEESTESPNKMKYFAEISLIPIHDDMGVCTHILYSSKDISRYKLAEAELDKQKNELKVSNQELERFAYVVSHDLNEPLRMINGYINILARRYSDKLDETANEFMGYILDGVKRLESLLNGILEYSRIAGSDQNEDADFNEILKEAKANIKYSIDNNNVIFKEANLPCIKANNRQMIRLIQNLISNSIKYRSESPLLIEINIEKNSNEYIFSIKDNGIGIEQKYFSKIFDIFQRLHTRQDYPGEGLGLAICKKIVERHNGKIWVESEVGKGSTFYFSIPKN